MPPILTRVRSRVIAAAVTSTTLLAIGLGAGLVSGAHADSTDKPLPVDLSTATGGLLEKLLDSGKITSKGLAEAYLARIAQLNSHGPGLNAVRALNPNAVKEASGLDAERKRHRVRGPLHGIPVLVKDNIDVEGMPTTAGSVALKSSYPKDDAPLVKRLRGAGAVILGKTNLTEFANFMTSGMPSGYSSLGGQVLNPYDVSQTPSGSSSGSGSAAAGALAALTVGTETSGSILSPSNANSLVGVKPTIGLISRTGVVPISATQDTAGPMTRSVYDAAAMMTWMKGVDPEDPATEAGAPYASTDYTRSLSTSALQGTRLGYVESADPVYAEALNVLRREGATLVPVTLSTSGLPPSILTYEFKRDLNAYLDRLPDSAPMDTLADIVAHNDANATAATKFGQTQLTASQAVDLEAEKAKYEADREAGLTQSRARIDDALSQNNVQSILFPGSGSAGIGARAGYPTVIVPAGYSPANRRPVGLSFLGTAFSEAKLLGFAYDYEQASHAWRPPSQINPTLFQCAVAPAPRHCAP
ncbi:amidase family protein [Actinomadura alba]|uniref:Amidase n=1 Tax=Actinomadura alba TaxID=406431 RepID=A0ABR7LVL2_9ACTN|nr:amidase family protein [Actinomadura alba]MBC6468886.1 amidase [Actinomadura alba]